jgi:hypothetical protein
VRSPSSATTITVKLVAATRQNLVRLPAHTDVVILVAPSSPQPQQRADQEQDGDHHPHRPVRQHGQAAHHHREGSSAGQINAKTGASTARLTAGAPDQLSRAEPNPPVGRECFGTAAHAAADGLAQATKPGQPAACL